jgi:two-component system NtrC family response regulator
VGGEHPVKTNVRLIAASNVDLEQAVKQRTFREDLFYRLDVVRLEIPPLRERQEDIPLLAEYFMKKLNPDQQISIGAMHLLCSYAWPGNIRELSNTIKQAAALCDDQIILPGHLPVKLQQLSNDPDACSTEQQWLSQINSCLEAMVEQVDIPAGFDVQGFLDELKKSVSRNMRNLISRALQESYGQYPRAAEWFRTTPRVLRYLHDEKHA